MKLKSTTYSTFLTLVLLLWFHKAIVNGYFMDMTQHHT
ncbi:hypothetical protein B4088_2775 [Bacillus cereus]|uniref:Uncharacterized protein n=1 Tax=Bacillus cereus TaxID=1396 RepID=A0A164NZA7_BACCE|nr:hypothetical protein B4088_2775 [Bacillus cereus]